MRISNLDLNKQGVFIIAELGTNSIKKGNSKQLLKCPIFHSGFERLT